MAFNIIKWREFSIDTLIENVKKYNDKKENIEKIIEAYNFAKKKHVNPDGTPVLRNSGEPYISHPVAVANFLVLMRCDVDTICAGLLHDTIEDTDVTKEDIEKLFGKDVSEIVEGVTKINKMDTHYSKEELHMYNTKKIIDSLLYDPRIVIVKLADRLHNMLTIGYKTPDKQRSKSIETISIYAPIANRLGMYRVQKELENASFKCLYPELHSELLIKREELKQNNMPMLEEMLDNMEKVIRDNLKVIGGYDIAKELDGLEGEELENKKDLLMQKVFYRDRLTSRPRIKHLYGIYDALTKIDSDQINKDKISDHVKYLLEDDENFDKIHDLRVIKLIFENEDQCFSTIRFLHQQYIPINKQKDYINNPKPNLYQSLHSTVKYKGKSVQFQIRTREQEFRDTYGLAWELYKFEGPNARERILEEFKKYPEYNTLKNILDNPNLDINTYQESLDKDVLYPKQIIVINKETGANVSLRENSTIRDYAYHIGGKLGDHLVSAVLNDEKYTLRYKKNGDLDTKYYPFDIELKPGDEISVEFDEKIITPRPSSFSLLGNKKKTNNKKLTYRKDN